MRSLTQTPANAFQRRSSPNLVSGSVLVSAFVFLGSCLFYVFPKTHVSLFFIAFTLQFFAYLFLFRQYRLHRMGMRSVIVLAILARLILIFTYPYLENDFFRFLWDGRVLAHGFNPYNYLPLDPALDSIGVSYRNMVDWSSYHTIYPPLALIQFSFAHLLFPDSLLGLKVFFVGFDLFAAFFLWKSESCLLNHGQKLDGKRVGSATLLYLLNPLILKEIANSAHFESLCVCLVAAAIYFYRIRHERKTFVLLGLATAAKLFPIFLFPLFLRKSSFSKVTLSAIFFITPLAFLYAPFLITLQTSWTGLDKFFRDWQWNAPLYQWIYGWGFAKEFLLILGLLWLGFIYVKREKFGILKASELAILGVLFVSPVVQPWYVLWLLPFSCLAGSSLGLSLSYFIALSYFHFSFENQTASSASYLILFEYGLWFVFLGFWNFIKRSRLPFVVQHRINE